MSVLVIACPEGMGEGDALLVTTPSGVDMEILVPAGVNPGDEFEVQFDEEEEGGGGQATSAVITCPEGMGEGDALLVTTPSGEEVEILVPAGVNPGDEFEVQFDDLAGEEPEAEAEAVAAAEEEAEAPALPSLEESISELQELLELEIVCPDGCGPGDVISVSSPRGEVNVEVPEGIAEGEAFSISISAEGDGEEEDEGDDEAALEAEVALATAIESGDVAMLLASIEEAEARQSLPPSFSLSGTTQS